jgi:hypothetical protein
MSLPLTTRLLREQTRVGEYESLVSLAAGNEFATGGHVAQRVVVSAQGGHEVILKCVVRARTALCSPGCLRSHTRLTRSRRMAVPNGGGVKGDLLTHDGVEWHRRPLG